MKRKQLIEAIKEASAKIDAMTAKNNECLAKGERMLAYSNTVKPREYVEREN